jgi:hypothetical protein
MSPTGNVAVFIQGPALSSAMAEKLAQTFG